MEDFTIYFRLGIDHILAPDALDHILFVTSLCLRFLWKDWKKVVVLVTAFTIGHSVTLALSALNYIHFPSRWIEFFIPITIAATCFNNIVQRKPETTKRLPVIYFFALFFGLIHGMAFAGQYLSIEGREGLVVNLLAFNLGIEVAQLAVVVVILFISFIIVQLLKLPRLIWLRGASVVILIFSLVWAFQRFPYNKNYNVETEHSQFSPKENALRGSTWQLKNKNYTDETSYSTIHNHAWGIQRHKSPEYPEQSRL